MEETDDVHGTLGGVRMEHMLIKCSKKEGRTVRVRVRVLVAWPTEGERSVPFRTIVRGSCHAPSMYHPCTIHVPSMHHCTIHLPSMYHPRTIHVQPMYHPCTTHVPSMYNPRTIHVPSTYHPCTALVPSCLLYTSPSPRDLSTSRMPSSA